MMEPSAEQDALAELASVCDGYGLPHSAAALDRHLTGNASLTIEVWKLVAEQQTKRLDAVRTILDAMGDPLDPKCLHPQAASLLIQMRDALDYTLPPGQQDPC